MTKSILTWGTAFMMLCSSLSVSCSDSNDDEGGGNLPVPSVTVAAGEAAAATLEFTLTLQDADKCAYLLQEKQAAAPDAAAILSSGKSATASGKIVCDALRPDTEYRLYALPSKGSVYGTIVYADHKTLARPVVTLTAGEVTETSLTFTATLADTDRAAYLCIEKGADTTVPTAQTILSDGEAIAASGEIPVGELKKSTTYLIAAAASKGSILSDVETIEMTTAGPLRLTQQALGGYFGKPSDSTYGEYRIVLADAPAAEADGVYATVGAGRALSMDLFQFIPTNLNDIKFPDRTYRYGTSKGLSSFHPDGTFCMVNDGSGNLTKIEFTGGKITVTKSGTTYTFAIELTTAAGDAFSALYEGPIAIEDKSAGEEEKLPELESDVTDIRFIRTLAKYYADSDQADNCIVHLYDVEPGGLSYGSDYLLGAGHMVSLDLSTAVSPTGVTELQQGDYTVSATGAPGTFAKGYQTTFMDDMLAVGTYCEKRNDQNLSVYGFIVSGKVSVTKDGGNYRFVLDLTTDKNHKITGTYEGAVEFTDKR